MEWRSLAMPIIGSGLELAWFVSAGTQLPVRTWAAAAAILRTSARRASTPSPWSGARCGHSKEGTSGGSANLASISFYLSLWATVEPQRQSACLMSKRSWVWIAHSARTFSSFAFLRKVECQVLQAGGPGSAGCYPTRLDAQAMGRVAIRGKVINWKDPCNEENTSLEGRGFKTLSRQKVFLVKYI